MKLIHDNPELIMGVLNAFREQDLAQTFLRPPKKEKEHFADKDKIDISHEVLLRRWKTYKIWLEEEANDAANFIWLADEAERYFSDKGAVISGFRLATLMEWWNKTKPRKEWAERYLGPVDPQLKRKRRSYKQAEDFLDLSGRTAEKALNQEERRRSIILTLISSVIVLAVVVAALLLLQKAKQHRDEIQTAAARAKATAESEFQTHNVEVARKNELAATVAKLRIEALLLQQSQVVAQLQSEKKKLITQDRELQEAQATLRQLNTAQKLRAQAEAGSYTAAIAQSNAVDNSMRSLFLTKADAEKAQADLQSGNYVDAQASAVRALKELIGTDDQGDPTLVDLRKDSAPRLTRLLADILSMRFRTNHFIRPRFGKPTGGYMSAGRLVVVVVQPLGLLRGIAAVGAEDPPTKRPPQAGLKIISAFDLIQQGKGHTVLGRFVAHILRRMGMGQELASAMSADGTRVAVSIASGAIRISTIEFGGTNPSTHKPRAPLWLKDDSLFQLGHTSTYLTFSNNGKYLLAAGPDRWSLLDLEGNKIRAKGANPSPVALAVNGPKTTPILYAAVSDDGSRLIAQDDSGGNYVMKIAASGEAQPILTFIKPFALGPGAAIFGADIANNLTGNNCEAVTDLRRAGSTTSKLPCAFQRPIVSLDYSAASKLMAASDGTDMQLVSLNGKPNLLLTIHGLQDDLGPITSVRFTPDGTGLIVIYSGGMVRLWDFSGLRDKNSADTRAAALINDLRAWAPSSTKEGTKASLTDLLHRAQEIVGNP